MEQSRAKNTTSRYTARVSMLGLKRRIRAFMA